MAVDSEDKGKMLAEGKQGKEEKISAINTAVKALPEEKHLIPHCYSAVTATVRDFTRSTMWFQIHFFLSSKSHLHSCKIFLNCPSYMLKWAEFATLAPFISNCNFIER